MSKKNIKTIHYRRKREGKTDYKKRLNLLKSGIPRLVVRKTNRNIIAQIIEYSPEGDKVVNFVTSQNLQDYGWQLSKSNTSAAYLVGLLLAQKTKVKEANLDIGLQTPVKGSKLFAVLKGCVDGGLNVPHSKKVIPDENRIKGKNVEEYAKNLKEKDKEKFQKLFSSHIDNKIDFDKYEKYFEKVKNNIIEGNKND